MNIGLTGGIATGKSTVSRMLVQRGAALIDADVIAREIMEPGHPVLAAVAKRFGQTVLHPDGTLDRKKLGEIVFADPERRKALENLTHPAIRAEMKQRLDALEAAAPRRLVVADIPLLYESGLERLYERIMVVYVPRDLQLARLMERDGLSRNEAERRLNAQMDIELKKERADILIDNSRGLDETERQIDEFGGIRECYEVAAQKRVLLLLFLGFIVLIFFNSAWLSLFYPIYYKEEIRYHAKNNGIDPFIVAAIIKSGNQLQVRSPVQKGSFRGYANHAGHRELGHCEGGLARYVARSGAK
ncbi:hypothetical protein HMSSN036_65190 [Paenibacillus macerans]|nr:hypothetical protein HMSSN036_65190 [Paenibacillus macerans]